MCDKQGVTKTYSVHISFHVRNYYEYLSMKEETTQYLEIFLTFQKTDLTRRHYATSIYAYTRP